jgi:hypothetical protein
MKEVINRAYDQIDEFIGKTLATANKAIENLTNVICDSYQKECLGQLVQEQEKLSLSFLIIEEAKSKNVEVPKKNRIWTWSTMQKGKNCVADGYVLKGVDKEISNCFIEPSFGFDDIRTVNLLSIAICLASMMNDITFLNQIFHSKLLILL